MNQSPSQSGKLSVVRWIIFTALMYPLLIGCASTGKTQAEANPSRGIASSKAQSRSTKLAQRKSAKTKKRHAAHARKTARWVVANP